MAASHRIVRALTGALVVAACAAAAPVRAALFEDDEARRAILELRARVERIEQEQRTRGDEQSRQIAQANEQLAQLRRSLLELNNTIETLRGEIARMRGQDEQLARDVAELQRRQKDAITGVDERIRKLEPQKVSLDGKEFYAEADEKRLFDEAMAAFRSSDFDVAIGGFKSFLARFPGSGYRPSSLFWLGNAQYAKRDYKEAITSFRAVVASAPAHAKAPEALLAAANCQVELKDRAGARRTLDELLREYPKSEAAQAGRERLASLRP
jgi:tol-pal system protein YbgF